MNIKLPKALLESGVVKRFAVTDHARRQYFDRIGPATDEEIIEACRDNPNAVWRGGALVTYYDNVARNATDG